MRLASLIPPLLGLLACGAPERAVVVYTSHDQVLSEPILQLFEERSGIDVRPVYDTEATKTTGLVNRIISEAGRPRCDVFWNNEIVQTLRLVERGATQAYRSPSAEGIPSSFHDPNGHWTGFAARARVVVVNTDALAGGEPTRIRSYEDVFESPDRSAGLALPLFGTTASHFALICAQRGSDSAEEWLRSLADGPTQILDSNGQVCDAVARGALAWGWTDTDDVAVARAEGQPVDQILPSAGVILIPNTVAMIAGAPHPGEARALIDFLLSAEVERRLAEGPGRQIPLHPGVPVPDGVLRMDRIAVQSVNWPAVAAVFDEAAEIVNRVLVEE